MMMTSANYGHIDSIDAHTGEQVIFIELAKAVFFTQTHTLMKWTLYFKCFLLCLLFWLLRCLFLNICCYHIPSVYVLVKFVLYSGKWNLKVTPVNYERYLVFHKTKLISDVPIEI